MVRVSNFIFAFYLLALSDPYSAIADFYSKDFAKAPGGTVRENQGFDLRLNRGDEAKSKQSSATTTGNVSPPRHLDTPPKLDLDDVKGEPVIEIGVLVNSADAVEVLSTLEKVRADQTNYGQPKIAFGPIGIAGDAKIGAISAKLAKLTALGARIVTSGDPLFAGVKGSPAWAIGTASGYKILEGLDDPTSLINSRGEFVSPDARPSSAPTPAPEVELEQFSK